MKLLNKSDQDELANIFFCYVYNESKKFIDPIAKKIATNNAEYNIVNKTKIFGHEVGFSTSLRDALIQAKNRGSKFLLYASIGNILRWRDKISTHVKNLILKNKNVKFAGHILENSNGSFYIDSSFFLINVSWAFSNNITTIEPLDNEAVWEGYILEKSKEYFYDDLSPVYIKSSKRKKKFIGRGEGYNIIEKLIETDSTLLIWPEEIRQNKFYLQPDIPEKVVLNRFKLLDLISINKVYITNTENINKERYNSLINYNIQKVFVPASGIQMILLSFYLKPKSTTIYDISNISLSFADKLVSKWDGRDFKSFIYDEVLNVDRFYKEKLYVNNNDLDQANMIVKSFGNEFIDWWAENRKNFNIACINLLDPKYLTVFADNMKELGDIPTLIHMSNIWDYKRSASFISIEERVQLLKNFRDYWCTLISEENFYVAGRNPVTSEDFKDKIIDDELNIGYKFPWN